MEQQEPRAEPDEYGYARRLVCAYFRMLTVGCGDTVVCVNRHCRSNRDFVELTPSEAAAKSILLATQAPVPICTNGQTSALVGFVAGDEKTEEDRPEVDEDEDEEEGDEEEQRLQAELACSPRRRLSHAMEMDLALNANEPTRDDGNTGEEEICGQRHTSLHKQKLLNALRQSFPELPPGLQVAKKH